MITRLYVDWKLEPRSRKPLASEEQIEKSVSKNKKVLAVIQARTTSSRFPNKIYAQLNGAPLLFHTINRVCLTSSVSTTLVASVESLDLPPNIPIFVYAGNVGDVLGRFKAAMERYVSDYVVRITSDCPVLDPFLIEYVVVKALEYEADYCSNVLEPTFPDGQDVEVISSKLLGFLDSVIKDEKYREHVTLKFRDNMVWQNTFKTVSIINMNDYSGIKCSIDTPDDLKNLEKMELV